MTFHPPFESNDYDGIISKILDSKIPSVSLNYSSKLKEFVDVMLFKGSLTRISMPVINLPFFVKF
jgi:hypothetical protein